MSERNPGKVVELGKLVPDGMWDRDAVHVAVFPAVADVTLKPGTHVGVRTGIVSPHFLPGVGIVDPFLLTPVKAGQVCYVCLYPNTVTSLRHSWTHPELDEVSHG